MLRQAVDNYLALRRACGFNLTGAGQHLRSFAAFHRRAINTTSAPPLPSSGRDQPPRVINAPAGSAP